MSSPSSSFDTKRLHGSTFLVTEKDAYREHPLIYVKIHPTVPVIVLGDTGCDRASKDKKHARFTHLRAYLEQCPLPCNKDKPLNPRGEKRYLIIISHCHYDHTLGIPQFLRGGQTVIVASAAGRDFIESDLAGNGLYRPIGEIAQPWKVTHWAQAFEKLRWPLSSDKSSVDQPSEDLGITIIHTPGHTPDQLAWYDHSEMHLYVGDTFYERGPSKMDIIWPSQGNMIEWHLSVQKLWCFVRSANAHAFMTAEQAEGESEHDEWVQVAKRVRIGSGHQTANVDGEDVLAALERFWWEVLRGNVPEVVFRVIAGEVTCRWTEPDDTGRFSFRAPRRLVHDARRFFNGNGLGVSR